MDEKITIRRGNEPIGEFDRFELRQAIDSGDVKLSDQYFDQESKEWFSLIPAYRRRWSKFDWAETDELLCFYIRDGMIHGPRMPDELDVLISSGYLPQDTLITTLGWDDWVPYDSLEEPLADTGDELKFEAKNAMSALLEGDFVSAGISGAKAAGKLLKWFSEPEKITSEWLSISFLREDFSTVEELVEIFTNRGVAPNNTFTEEDDDLVTVYLQFKDMEEAERARDACDLKIEYNGNPFSVSAASKPA